VETRAKQQVRAAAEKRFMSAEETPDCGQRESAGAEGEDIIFVAHAVVHGAVGREANELSVNESVPSDPRPAAELRGPLEVSGRWFRCGGEKGILRGVTYGPFGPAAVRGGLPEPGRVAADLEMLAGWGANAMRLYEVPPPWFLDACGGRGLRVLAGIPWTDHIDFLTSSASRRAVRLAVVSGVRRLAGRPEVAALVVGNEIPAPLVRWLGYGRVEAFLDELIEEAQQQSGGLPVSYANYPSTEFLQPGRADFAAWNVYLEDAGAFRRYLERLHHLAGDRPLVISEFGADAARLGGEAQAVLLQAQRQACEETGTAGHFLFSFTDAWWRGGKEVSGWNFGLTDPDRQPRPAWFRLRGDADAGRVLPAEGKSPAVSVIVCTRNGHRTLRDCLAGLARLNYPDCEVIVVDDGSRPGIAAICGEFPGVRCLRQEAAGLGMARNAGASVAGGTILAYTDDDCLPDADWLRFLVRAFDDPGVGAAGGPNVPPRPVTAAQACVMAAPGAPAQVLRNDREAEHIPGCNLAVRASVFAEVGGFGAEYHAAGDDVDFCWKVLSRGWRIAPVPAAVVWHYRRFSALAYLRQQAGYGKAEALLMGSHADRFGDDGGARWEGVVYDAAQRRLGWTNAVVYSGRYGLAGYQGVYERGEGQWLGSGFGWWSTVAGLAAASLFVTGLWPLPLVMAFVSFAVAGVRARRLVLPSGWDRIPNRLLLAWLLLLQPVVRKGSRFFWRMLLGVPRPCGPSPWPHGPAIRWLRGGMGNVTVAGLRFGSASGTDRHDLLHALAGQGAGVGDGWEPWDLLLGSRGVRVLTVTEYHAAGNVTRVRCMLAGWRVAMAAAAAALAVLLLAAGPPWQLAGWMTAAAAVFCGSGEVRAVRRAVVRIRGAASPLGFHESSAIAD
jgi:glycosyltransferase involved in cell wall biosynthesis